MNITVNVVCRKDKANKNGTTPIHLRFTRGSKIRCVSTGTAIVPTAWDAQNRRIIIQNEEPQEIQYRIDSLLAEYHKRLKRLEILEADITLDNLLERNGRKNDGSNNPATRTGQDKHSHQIPFHAGIIAESPAPYSNSTN